MALSNALNLDLAGFDRRHNRKNWDMDVATSQRAAQMRGLPDASLSGG
jgi:hypothetical protein